MKENVNNYCKHGIDPDDFTSLGQSSGSGQESGWIPSLCQMQYPSLFIIVTSNYAAFRLNAKIITAKETNRTLSVIVAQASIPCYNYNAVAMCELGMGRRRRKIESNAKCHYLKITCK